MTTHTLKTHSLDCPETASAKAPATTANPILKAATAVLRAPGIVLDYLADLQARETARRHLLELSDHQLKDIGATRDEIYREASKPVWRR